MKELKNNVNTLLWLMVTLSLLVMFSLVCLSSCNSSVKPDKTSKIDQGGSDDNPKTVSLTFKLSKDKEALKKDDLSVKVKRGTKILEDFAFDNTYSFIENDEIQIEVKGIDLKEGKAIYWELYSKEKTNDTKEDVKAVIREGESKNKSFSLKIDSDLLNKANVEGFVFYTYIEDEMLKFLKEKIGFDRSYKHKRDVIYGKDVSQEQLKIEAENKANGKEYAIYTADSLGFGKAEAGEICYHGYNSYKDSIVSMTVEEELDNDNRNDNGNDLKKLGITKNFESIRDGLEKRWMALHKGTLGNSLYYYNANDAPDGIARSLISTIGGSYDFGLGSDKEDYKLYMWANSASKYSYYMDLRIAFVKESDPDKGYSVHFANVKNGKYEPYVLHNAGDSKYTTYPPGAVPEYTESTEEGMRMFTLSSLLKTSLENLHKKESKEWKYSEQELVDALLEEVKDKNYDTYIILGCVRNTHDKEYFNSKMTAIGTYWCNVLKFNDPFWETLETKKP